MLDKEMSNENQSVPLNGLNEDTSRVHTPTPSSRTSPGHETLLATVIPPPIDIMSAPTDYDSGNDTEPEGTLNAQPSLGAFSSFYTYHTAATSPDSSVLQVDSGNPIPLTLSPSPSSLRRSISADRLTMRSTQTVMPPPLIRTQSEGPTIATSVPTSSALPPTLKLPVSATRPTKVDTRAAGSSNGMDVNTLLNTFCGDHAYLNRSDGPIYGSDTESNDEARDPKAKIAGTPGSKLLTDDKPPRLFAKDKGKGRVDGRVEYDSDGVYLSAISDTEPSPSTSACRSRRFNFGSSDNTDDEIRYDTVSEGISDSEDIDISAYIPTTASMPPFPAPTVSRSRSSSRSFPSPAFMGNIPPVPPLPAFAMLGGRTRASSSPRLASSSSSYSPAQDQRSLHTPTPTQPPSVALPPTPSSASFSSSMSFSSTAMEPLLGSSPSSVPLSPLKKSRQRSASESGGGNGVGSGSGSGSNSRGRLHQLAQALRKSPSVSPGRGIEHIKPITGRSKDRPKFTIAFVGSAGCGKTAMIEKASKSANSKFKQETIKRNVCFGGEELTVEFRDVAVVVDKTRNTAPISTVEVNSALLIAALDRGSEFWPESLPAIDGVVLCYDASREGSETKSFNDIERLNDAFAAQRHPIIWVGCKSDWIRQPKKDSDQPSSPRVLPEGIVPPHEVFLKANEAHTGLIEVTKGSNYGKEQMRNLFTWMYKSAARLRREKEKQQNTSANEYLNHASPEVLDRKPSQKSHRHAPTNSPDPPVAAHHPNPLGSTSPTEPPVSPTSLQLPRLPMTRARSMSDLLSQEARDRVTETSAAILRKASATVTATQLSRSMDEPEPGRESAPEPELERESQSTEIMADNRTGDHNTSIIVLPPKLRIDPFAFMTLDDLIVRLSGGILPGYDILFNQGFMLTYRRFATPREVLLAIIRRLRSITNSEEMRRAVLILFDYLLEWTYQHPQDFGAPGAMAPFEVLIRMFRDIYSHKGAPKLQERIEYLQTQTDDTADWAKPETRFTEGEDSDGEDPDSHPHSAELRRSPVASVKVSVNTSVAVAPVLEPEKVNEPNELDAGPPTAGLRPKSFFLRRNSMDPPPRVTMSEKDERELRRMAKAVLNMDPEHFAEEITREDKAIFMDLKARDWLRHAYTTRRDRDPAVHPLDRASYRFERIGHIVASFILVLNKTRQRAYMFEFWIKVATSLRNCNNFAALHTVVAAMNKVYAGGDGPNIERFVQAGELEWNNMRVLILKSNGGAYKTALKHASLPLIPTMAIHTSDIVRVMSNRDYKEDNPQLVHWGKFQIIARIAKQMLELQDRIQRNSAYNFQPHPEIAQILRDVKPMSEEMIVEKTYPPQEDLPPPKPGSAWSARVIRKVLK